MTGKEVTNLENDLAVTKDPLGSAKGVLQKVRVIDPVQKQGCSASAVLLASLLQTRGLSVTQLQTGLQLVSSACHADLLLVTSQHISADIQRSS